MSLVTVEEESSLIVKVGKWWCMHALQKFSSQPGFVVLIAGLFCSLLVLLANCSSLLMAVCRPCELVVPIASC